MGRHPGSRRQPQFGQDALRESLAAHGVAYRWLPALGGRRRPRPDSRNTAWRNVSLRGYADHLESAAFAGGLDELRHRALIADVLRVRGIEVAHILDAEHCVAHPYTSPARIVEGRLSYGQSR